MDGLQCYLLLLRSRKMYGLEANLNWGSNLHKIFPATLSQNTAMWVPSRQCGAMVKGTRQPAIRILLSWLTVTRQWSVYRFGDLIVFIRPNRFSFLHDIFMSETEKLCLRTPSKNPSFSSFLLGSSAIFCFMVCLDF